jgi:hypothetical protein
LIVIPSYIWTTVLDCFSCEERDVERVAFLDGVSEGGRGIVTSVVIPNAILRRQSYDVPASAISEAAVLLRNFGLHRLAQIHSHGTAWVDHSPRDDEGAYSHAESSTSIVVPFHGRYRPNLEECGVHMIVEGRWARLSPQQVTENIIVIPSLVRS